MYKRTKILAPVVDEVIQSASAAVWPAYDGTLLDRRRYVSSSEAGQCERRVWFSKYATLSEGKVAWGFFERGHSYEAWLVQKLRQVSNEWAFLNIGDEQVSFYSGYQSGTPDGIAINNELNENVLLEFKSIDPRTKLSNLPKQDHLSQTIQNMDLVEECYDMTFDYGLLMYTNASDYSLMYEYVIDRKDPQVGEEIIRLETRAERIMNAKCAEELSPEGIYNGGCKQCPFTAQCSAAMVANEKERERHDKIGKASRAFFG